ncbi:MAG: cell division protein FtsL [Oligoflexia bacterium]|nr:cell division protein FtsL [Oligoflexia bacterium]
MHGKKRVIAFILIVMSGLIGYLWTRLEVIRYGYEYQDLASIKKKLIEENRRIRLQYARELSPERVEAYARERLGLDKPVEKQFRYLK